MEAVRIGMSALDVEWTRVQVIAENIANMNSVITDPASGYMPMRLVSGPARNFSAVLSSAGSAYDAPPVGVRVTGLEPMANGLRQVHEPNHPLADHAGMVTYPKIDYASEMTLLLKSSRVYEANLASVSIAQQMYSRALDMGRQS